MVTLRRFAVSTTHGTISVHMKMFDVQHFPVSIACELRHDGGGTYIDGNQPYLDRYTECISVIHSIVSLGLPLHVLFELLVLSIVEYDEPHLVEGCSLERTQLVTSPQVDCID